MSLGADRVVVMLRLAWAMSFKLIYHGFAFTVFSIQQKILLKRTSSYG